MEIEFDRGVESAGDGDIASKRDSFVVALVGMLPREGTEGWALPRVRLSLSLCVCELVSLSREASKTRTAQEDRDESEGQRIGPAAMNHHHRETASLTAVPAVRSSSLVVGERH